MNQSPIRKWTTEDKDVFYVSSSEQASQMESILKQEGAFTVKKRIKLAFKNDNPYSQFPAEEDLTLVDIDTVIQQVNSDTVYIMQNAWFNEKGEMQGSDQSKIKLERTK